MALNLPRTGEDTSEYLKSFRMDQSVTIIGKALNVKAGAVVVADSGGGAYIDGLSAWDDSTSGKKVRVTGTLRQQKIAPDSQVDESGAISAGMEGMTEVLEEARWTVIDP